MKDLKRAVKFAEEFLEIADDLEKVGNLEQAKQEGARAVSKVRQDLHDTQARLGTIRMDIEDAEDDLKLAKKGAEDTISLAKQAAQELVTGAKDKAKDIVRKALEQERMVADCIVVDQEQHQIKMKDYLDAEMVAQAAVLDIEEELADLWVRIGAEKAGVT